MAGILRRALLSDFDEAYAVIESMPWTFAAFR